MPYRPHTLHERLGPVALSSGFRGRPVVLVPIDETRDFRLFRAAVSGAIRSLDERAGSLVDLSEAVEREATKWDLRTEVRFPAGPDGPIEVHVARG